MTNGTLDKLIEIKNMPQAQFPQSKVQDILYHYTISENAEKIKKEGFKTAVELGGTFAGTNIDGVYLTPSEVNYWGGETATQFEQIAVKVNLEKPLDLSFWTEEKENYTKQEQALLDEFETLRENGRERYYEANGNNKFNKSLLATLSTKVFKEAGYDGLIAPGHQGLEYVVFDKNAICIVDNEAIKTKNHVKPNKTSDTINNLKNRIKRSATNVPYKPVKKISEIDPNTLKAHQRKKQNG